MMTKLGHRGTFPLEASIHRPWRSVDIWTNCIEAVSDASGGIHPPMGVLIGRPFISDDPRAQKALDSSLVKI